MSPSILPSNLLLIEEAAALTAKDRDVVIADINSEFSCKRVSYRGQGLFTLVPDNPAHNLPFLSMAMMVCDCR